MTQSIGRFEDILEQQPRAKALFILHASSPSQKSVAGFFTNGICHDPLKLHGIIRCLNYVRKLHPTLPSHLIHDLHNQDTFI